MRDLRSNKHDEQARIADPGSHGRHLSMVLRWVSPAESLPSLGRLPEPDRAARKDGTEDRAIHPGPTVTRNQL